MTSEKNICNKFLLSKFKLPEKQMIRDREEYDNWIENLTENKKNHHTRQIIRNVEPRSARWNPQGSAIINYEL